MRNHERQSAGWYLLWIVGTALAWMVAGLFETHWSDLTFLGGALASTFAGLWQCGLLIERTGAHRWRVKSVAQYVFATCGGLLCGSVAMMGSTVLLLTDGQSRTATIGSLLVGALIGGVTGGLVNGLGQRLVLRRALVSSSGWIWLSVIGWGLAFPLRWFVSLFALPGFSDIVGIPVHPAYAHVISYLASGALVACFSAISVRLLLRTWSLLPESERRRSPAAAVSSSAARRSSLVLGIVALVGCVATVLLWLPNRAAFSRDWGVHWLFLGSFTILLVTAVALVNGGLTGRLFPPRRLLPLWGRMLQATLVFSPIVAVVLFVAGEKNAAGQYADVLEDDLLRLTVRVGDLTKLEERRSEFSALSKLANKELAEVAVRLPHAVGAISPRDDVAAELKRRGITVLGSLEVETVDVLDGVLVGSGLLTVRGDSGGLREPVCEVVSQLARLVNVRSMSPGKRASETVVILEFYVVEDGGNPRASPEAVEPTVEPGWLVELFARERIRALREQEDELQRELIRLSDVDEELNRLRHLRAQKETLDEQIHMLEGRASLCREQ